MDLPTETTAPSVRGREEKTSYVVFRVGAEEGKTHPAELVVYPSPSGARSVPARSAAR